MDFAKKMAAKAKDKIDEKHPGLVDKSIEKAYAAKQAMKVATPRRFVAEQMGYPMEKYTYHTKDGYINSVFRIPGPKGT